MKKSICKRCGKRFVQADNVKYEFCGIACAWEHDKKKLPWFKNERLNS